MVFEAWSHQISVLAEKAQERIGLHNASLAPSERLNMEPSKKEYHGSGIGRQPAIDLRTTDDLQHFWKYSEMVYKVCH